MRLHLVEFEELDSKISVAMDQAVKDSISEFETHNQKNVNTIREEICALENKVDLRIEQDDQHRADGTKKVAELEALVDNLSYSTSQ
mmetsp:Transcript_11572/g.17480  ORF Transcript_11572/g.17480 Transcript_11572/m.17480 type:complete len:87 (+) Transcript_11572:1777-2037(+)